MNVLPEKPYDPKEPLSKWDELLRTAIIARDRVSVFNWLRKEVTKARGSKKAKSATAKSGADTMDILLGRLNGIEPGTLKGTAPYQLWAKEEGEEEQKLFRETFKNSGEPTRLRAGREAAHMSSLFAALPKETQKAYKARVAEGKAKAQEDRDRLRGLMEDPLPPLEAQQLIDRFGVLMTPFLDQMAKLSGMKILMVMGGPEPRRGVKTVGRIKALSPSSSVGMRLATIGVWRRSGNSLWKAMLAHYPGDEESKDAAESSGSVPYEEMVILNGLLQLEEEHFSDEDEAETAPAVKKKGGRAAKSATETTGETSQKGKRKRPTDDGKVSTKKAKTAGGGQADFTETSAGSRGKKKKETVSKKVVVGIGKSLAKIAGSAVPDTP
ncbi:hypothetical protein EV421DRAFT_1914274 [Armillaria borealis]|uniref:Uncharacterized protein n=1 Tax=Armillaria borealis TaxID=47425 RepID=A0AA39ITQ1_9AGAR|nr:hypothetical protein EV421DRAFT_1914274 [Armillaria borealis]